MSRRAYRRFHDRIKERRLRKMLTYARKRGQAGWLDYDYDENDNKVIPRNAHVHYPKNSNRKKFAKRQTNRMIRREKNKALPKYGDYRRVFDYLWNVI